MRYLPGCCQFVVATLIVCTVSYGQLLPADKPVHEVVDHYIDAHIKQLKIKPAPPADPANQLRRTMLDLIGRPPVYTEVQAFAAADPQTRRQELVQTLVDSPGFVRHQATEFNYMLMRDANGDLSGYLKTAFEKNTGWDQMFREMMLGQNDDKEHKGAIEFIKRRVSDLDKLTNETSVLFFGVNVSCAKCHDHPEVSEWTQNHFYGMKSFFNRTFDNGGLLAERDYGLVKYKTVEGEEKQAKLMFLTGDILEEPEYKEPSEADRKAEKKRLEELKKKKQPAPSPQYSRRQRLVEIALQDGQNLYFARAIVNRLWARLFGQGIVSPVDQMHPANTPSHPELLDWLARDLIAHKYDLKRLISGLVLSDAYVRSSVWNGDKKPPRSSFAVARTRTLTPAQYAAVLKIGAVSCNTQFSSQVDSRERLKKLNDVAAGASGLARQFELPGDGFQISASEALWFTNNPRARNDLLRDGGGTLLQELKDIESAQDVARTAIQNVFAREPEDEELKALVAFLEARKDRRSEAHRELVWALLTSSECRFNY